MGGAGGNGEGGKVVLTNSLQDELQTPIISQNVSGFKEIDTLQTPIISQNVSGVKESFKLGLLLGFSNNNVDNIVHKVHFSPPSVFRSKKQ